MISSLGGGLNILISCDYSVCHNWMAYLCWYSINKNLPDAKVFITCCRNNVNCNLFSWTKKVNVPFRMYNGEYKLKNSAGFADIPMLILPPDVVAIRDFEESGLDPNVIKDVCFVDNTSLICDAKEEEFCVFASYSNGWGKFVTSEWINRSGCPLLGSNFKDPIMTFNEVRISDLWKASSLTFQTISGDKYEKI
jgi:hypothetical protein